MRTLNVMELSRGEMLKMSGRGGVEDCGGCKGKRFFKTEANGDKCVLTEGSKPEKEKQREGAELGKVCA